MPPQKIYSKAKTYGPSLKSRQLRRFVVLASQASARLRGSIALMPGPFSAVGSPTHIPSQSCCGASGVGTMANMATGPRPAQHTFLPGGLAALRFPGRMPYSCGSEERPCAAPGGGNGNRSCSEPPPSYLLKIRGGCWGGGARGGGGSAPPNSWVCPHCLETKQNSGQLWSCRARRRDRYLGLGGGGGGSHTRTGPGCPPPPPGCCS